MGSQNGSAHWSVFDNVKFLPSTPDALLAEINAAIAALEYAQVTARLGPSFMRGNSSVRGSGSVYDADIAEEAYHLGCAALSEGKVDVGLESLNISLSKCPPDQIDAVAKVRSLISFTVQQLQVVVSMIRSRAMEAKLRKGSILNHNYSFVLHPTSGVLFVSKAKRQAYDDHSAQKQENSKVNEEMDDFASVKSHFSPCIATAVYDSEAYFSVKTDFSCCSSLKDPDSAENRWWFQKLRIILKSKGVQSSRKSVIVRAGHLVSAERHCCFHLCQNPH